MSETSRSTEKRADRAFARYATEGDIDALAEVFDLCAPRLALVAGHLVPFDRAAIDDLIQSTFADAIRSASRFEPGRPVLPWLTTILARRATDRARRSGRRAETALDDVAEPLDEHSLDPADLAADSELVEQVLKAIDEVGPPYAEVLRLRWSHDLSPQEIARALDRPLGTVLSQCQRGLERLRKRLPDRMALALAPLVVPDLRLGVIREEILRLGHELARPLPVVPAPTPAPVPFLVAVMSTKLLSVAALTAALILLAVFAFDAEAPPQLTDPESATVLADGAQSEVASTNTERVANQPGGSAEARSEEPDVDGGLVHFTGRVLAAESGLPLAGVEVVATEEHGLAFSGPSVMRVVEHRAETDSDGRYALSLRSPDVGVTRVWLLASDRVRMEAYFSDPLRDGLDFDLGDVEMTIGPRMRVAMLDDEGHPIPFATLELDGDHWLRSGVFVGSGWSGMLRADASGTVHSAGPVSPGTWEIDYVSDHGLEEPAETSIEVPARAGLVATELRYGPIARPEWTLRGRIVDERGAPVTGVEVSGSREGDLGARTCQVLAQGRFALSGMLDGRGPVQLAVGPSDSDIHDRYEVLQPNGPVTPGDEDILLVVRRSGPRRLHARLVDRSGAPVERFGRVGHRLVDREDGMAASRYFGGTRAQTHPDGEVMIEPLPSGRHRLMFFPEREDLEPIVSIDVDLSAALDGPAIATARPAAHRAVVVQDDAGEPVAGAQVEWLVSPLGAMNRVIATYVVDEMLAGRSGFASIPAYSVSSASTDANGSAMLRTGPVLAGSQLRVSHPRFEQLSLDFEAGQVGDQPIRVTLRSAARLEGRLTPFDVVQAVGPYPESVREAALAADPVVSLQWNSSEVRLIPVDDGEEIETVVDLTGGFRFHGVPAGSYRIEFEPRRGDRIDLGEIVLGPGEARSEVYDIGALRTHPVRGMLRVNGETPPPGTRLDFRPGVELAEDGSFDCQLRSGTHEVRVYVPVPGDREVGIDVGTIEVWSDMPTPVLQLEASYRSITFEIQNDDGTPRQKAWVLWRPVVDGEPQGRRRIRLVARDGQLRIDHAWTQPILFELGLTPPAERNGEWTDVIPIGVIDRPREAGSVKRVVRVPAGR